MTHPRLIQDLSKARKASDQSWTLTKQQNAAYDLSLPTPSACVPVGDAGEQVVVQES